MARLNQSLKRKPGRRMQAERRASLETLGANIGEIMRIQGVGERRAMAEAERSLGVRWHNGIGEKPAGHYAATA